LDRKTGYGLSGGNYVGYSADLASVTDYYPFGMPMPGRNNEATDYRFGQGTQMKSDEVYGDGSLYTAEYWEYDSRLGGRWNRDPITYPWQSSYAAFDNSPIVKTDPLGLYGTKSEAEKMQGRAKTAGYDPGEVYENGKGWGFNYTDDKGDNATTFTKTNFSDGGKRYDGSYMKPASAYRWRRGNMPEKERDDEAFIKYGSGGNSFSRWWKTVRRDWDAPQNSEVTQDIDDVAPAVAAQATVLGGAISSVKQKTLPGPGLIGRPINQGAKQLKWILEKHGPQQLVKHAGKSRFYLTYEGELGVLIQNATHMPVIVQPGGNLLRVVNAGKIIGYDATTGKATSIYSVITNPNTNDLITAFPGLPTY